MQIIIYRGKSTIKRIPPFHNAKYKCDIMYWGLSSALHNPLFTPAKYCG